MQNRTSLKIAIGNDHAGTPYKLAILEMLEKENHSVTNYGTDSEESVDYPDFVHPVAEMVTTKSVDFGIIICGSGNGAAMTANKHQNIRAALCWNNELVKLARKHNNANILSLPARFITIDHAKAMVKTFLTTDFEGGRHQNRVAKIPVNC